MSAQSLLWAKNFLWESRIEEYMKLYDEMKRGQ